MHIIRNKKIPQNTCNLPPKVVYYKRHKEKGKSESKNLALNSCKIGGKIEEKVESLVKDKIEKIGYELYDVIYTKEGSNKILRIVIDSEKGISLDDCEKVNNEIKETIDEANPIEEQYFLEISSPGIERVLRKDKHLEKNIGEEVTIKLFKKDENGKKEYLGKLKDFNQEKIVIEQEEKDINIERKNISQIKTVYNW